MSRDANPADPIGLIASLNKPASGSPYATDPRHDKANALALPDVDGPEVGPIQAAVEDVSGLVEVEALAQRFITIRGQPWSAQARVTNKREEPVSIASVQLMAEDSLQRERRAQFERDQKAKGPPVQLTRQLASGGWETYPAPGPSFPAGTPIHPPCITDYSGPVPPPVIEPGEDHYESFQTVLYPGSPFGPEKHVEVFAVVNFTDGSQVTSTPIHITVKGIA